MSWNGRNHRKRPSQSIITSSTSPSKKLARERFIDEAEVPANFNSLTPAERAKHIKEWVDNHPEQEERNRLNTLSRQELRKESLELLRQMERENVAAADSPSSTTSPNTSNSMSEGEIEDRPIKRVNSGIAISPTLQTQPQPSSVLGYYGQPRPAVTNTLPDMRAALAEFAPPAWWANTVAETGSIPKILRDITRAFIKFQSNPDSENTTNLRKLLQELVFTQVSPGSLKRTEFLAKSNVSGLPQMAINAKLPWDIRADCKQLFYQYSSECFQYNPFGGLIISYPNNGLRLDEDPDAQPPYQVNNFRFYGHNGTSNGQWWPRLIGTHRDGTHGHTIAGISGDVKTGAYSILVAMQYEDDRDTGDDIIYTGTRSKTPNKPTNATEYMLASRLPRGKNKVKNPIRVVRSYKGCEKSKYCPIEGYRYDGLYEVVDYKLLDSLTQHYEFQLQRIADQDPIRWQGEEIRPNAAERAWWAKEQRMQGR
jgi:hypothetical protein